ncbi:MAG: riboflavin kinase, partial [Bilifractor sp.]
LLGQPYFITGKIVHGRHLGHSLGFPTINQIPDPVKMTPPRGVYYSRTLVAGRWYQGISNIGIKPTVGGTAVGLETYLFDCTLDLYGQEARVELLSFRRPEEKFSDINELKEQMDRDIQAADNYFSREE